MGKPLTQDYQPSNPPTKFESWHRWIVEEFQRLSRALKANPVIVTVKQFAAPVNIDPVPQIITLGIGVEPEIDFPGGDYDSLTGVWTCPLDGVYMITASVEIAPFGAGNKAYQADIIIFKNGVEEGRSVDTAVDDVPLSVNMVSPGIFAASDEVRFDLETVHSQFTGATTYDYSMSMVRLGQAN